RDKRRDRVKLAYDAMVNGIRHMTHDVLQPIANSYQLDITDEFLKPIIHLRESRLPMATIDNGDEVISFKFRTDRGRGINGALTQRKFPEFGMHRLPMYYVTMTNYDKDFSDVRVVFNEDILTGTLGEVLEKNEKSQIRVAETEKYPHVTFFF